VRRLPWSVGWEHEVVPAEAAEPATLTCDVAALTGDPKAHRPSGPIYIVYTGRGAAEQECIQLSFSTDGEAFEAGSADEFGRPLPLPPQATHVRFTIRAEGALSGFCAIATEAG
jgi:hypothetical protein